jgi:hypothetical protein
MKKPDEMARPRLRMILLVNLLILFLIESLIRTAAGLGWVSLPSSTVAGFDRLIQGDDPPARKRLYEPDRNLIVHLRPNARIVYKRFAIFPGARNDYEVRTNALGFRTPDFHARKAPRVFRILCLGDSSTFGMNIERMPCRTRSPYHSSFSPFRSTSCTMSSAKSLALWFMCLRNAPLVLKRPPALYAARSRCICRARTSPPSPFARTA